MKACVCAWLLPALQSTAGIAAEPAKALEDAARTSATRLARGGIVVGVHEHGKAPRYSAFGKLKVDAGARPEALIFEIGSISKLFTSRIVALVLHSNGIEQRASKKD